MIMPSHRKGEKVEPGIWRVVGAPNNRGPYITEVSYTDLKTRQRVREIKTIHRLDLAREWRTAKQTDALRGEVTRKKEVETISFKDFADLYYETWKQDRKASTAYSEKNRINGILKPYFGNKPIHAITRRDIDTFLRKRREGTLKGTVARKRRNNRQGGVSPASTNRDLCRLKNIFKKAVEWEYIKDNPALGIQQSKEMILEAEYLTVDEATAFLADAETAYKPIFVTAIYTGLRFGELMGLQWRDINWDFNRVAVRDAKNSDSRYVPMNQAVRKALVGLLQERETETQLVSSSELVFINKETGNPFVDVRKAMKRALKASGVTRHIRFHDLRHTTGSHLAMNGGTEREIAEVLGHRDTKVTRRYTHLSPSHVQALVDGLDFEAKKDEENSSGNDAATGT
jgi:integrase